MHSNDVLLLSDALHGLALASKAKITQTPRSGSCQRTLLGRAAGTEGAACDKFHQHQLPGAQSPRTWACQPADSRTWSRVSFDQLQHSFSAWLSARLGNDLHRPVQPVLPTSSSHPRGISLHGSPHVAVFTLNFLRIHSTGRSS